MRKESYTIRQQKPFVKDYFLQAEAARVSATACVLQDPSSLLLSSKFLTPLIQDPTD